MSVSFGEVYGGGEQAASILPYQGGTTQNWGRSSDEESPLDAASHRAEEAYS
ncbi:hypothetical protein [Nocardia sp. NPDC058666]|uniref:hypothetical protein n=1 Tax=Nocardia sp. NPDC058666 TaxID=3346587 RepID=UPI00364C359F